MKLKGYSKMKAALVAMAIIVTGASCDKDGDTTPIVDKANLALINLVEDAASLDAHLGETKINTTALEYGQFSAYRQVDAGTATVSIFETGETDTIASASNQFAASKDFSAFIIGTKENTSVVISNDDLKAPASGKAKIRFANLVDGDDLLDLWVGEIEDQDEALISEINYKKVGDFVEIDAAADALLQVKINGQEDVFVALDNASLQAGSIYSIVAWEQVVEGEKNTVLSVIKNK